MKFYELDKFEGHPNSKLLNQVRDYIESIDEGKTRSEYAAIIRIGFDYSTILVHMIDDEAMNQTGWDQTLVNLESDLNYKLVNLMRLYFKVQ